MPNHNRRSGPYGSNSKIETWRAWEPPPRPGAATSLRAARQAPTAPSRPFAPTAPSAAGSSSTSRMTRSSTSKAIPRSPISHGCLCPKGAATFQLVTGSHRVQHVLYRRPHGTDVGDRFRSNRRWTWSPSA